MKGLFDITKKFYIWLYKREKWNCEHDCFPNQCACWCKFSQERRETSFNKRLSLDWGRFFDTIDEKIDSMVMTIKVDYNRYKRLLPVKKILYKKIPNYNFDRWDADDVQWQIREYENMIATTKKIYNTIQRFLDCVVIANKLDYFKHVYFKNWKNCCMTQRDFQFELSIYCPTKWKKYLSKCHKLRTGKLIGPKLSAIKFPASC